MNVRSVIITVIILAVVGALAVVAQLSDRNDLLSRVNFFRDEPELTDAEEEQTVNNELDTLLMDGEAARAEEPRPAEVESDDEEPQPPVNNENRVEEDPEGEVAGAHDVEVSAETGAGGMTIWMAMAAMLLGMAGVAAAKYAV